jgi:hypothetical protein
MSPLEFEAKKIALKQDSNGFVLTLAVHPDEAPEELLRDFVGARYVVVMVRILDDETKLLYKNRVSQAAVLCKKLDFQMWLDVDSEAKAAAELCKRLEIKSRSELNGNKKAQELFDLMVKEYNDASLLEIG